MNPQRARRVTTVVLETVIVVGMGIHSLLTYGGLHHQPLPVFSPPSAPMLQNMPGVVNPITTAVPPAPVSISKIVAEPKNIARGEDNEEKRELVGTFKLTFYTPSVDECDSDPWTTASGTRTTPGRTVGVDSKYWKFGTKFYVEGYGYVIAEDNGTMRGPNRLDVCVATKKIALTKGIQYRKVWVIK